MKILLAYDRSRSAQAALKVAVDQAKAFAAHVTLLTSLTGGTATSSEDIKEAEEHLESARSVLENAGIPCDTHLLVKDLTPGEDIVDFANKNKIDVIIIGVKKKSKVGKLVFGSTAQYVILEASCPVLAVK
jgi:nucleotide-binding universal stress UspA family protein